MRPEQPFRDDACERARDLMIEGIALDPGTPPAQLAAHLAACPSCRLEWSELAGQVSHLRQTGESEPLPTISADLMQRTLLRLDQVRPADPVTRHDIIPSHVPANDDGYPVWWVRVLQHTYLAVLGIGLWFSLMLGQTAFLDAMRSCGLEFSEWVMLDYGLFVAWFITGGLSAMMALPLLLQDTWNQDPTSTDGSPRATNAERGLFGWPGKGRAGHVRCVVWVW